MSGNSRRTHTAWALDSETPVAAGGSARTAGLFLIPLSTRFCGGAFGEMDFAETN